MLKSPSASTGASDLRRPPSGREFAVLEAATHGLTNAEIAKRLGVTVHTVKLHLASSYPNLGAMNRTDAIVRCLRAGVGA